MKLKFIRSQKNYYKNTLYFQVSISLLTNLSDIIYIYTYIINAENVIFVKYILIYYILYEIVNSLQHTYSSTTT